MTPHTRAIVAAAAHAVLSGRKVAGLYDHAADRHLRIAAECRDGRLQGMDAVRGVRFGGTLPDLYDEGDQAFISLEADGATARGYDRGSASFYEARISDRTIQLYDHEKAAWFAFEAQLAEPG